jgi:hypothetical protein
MGVYSGADSEVPKEVDPGKHLRTHYYESVSAPEGRIPRPRPAVLTANTTRIWSTVWPAMYVPARMITSPIYVMHGYEGTK